MRRLMPMLLASLLASASPALAQGGPGPTARAPAAGESDKARSAKVEIRVMEVYATDTHSKVDPKLDRLTRYLTHLRYTGFELLDTHSVSLAPNGSQTFTIAGGRKMEITVLGKDERRVRMRVEVTGGKGGKLLDTTLSVNRNGTFIVAGPRYKDGVLVLPLTATY